MQPPRWTRFVLTAAAVYNLLWGTAAILFPLPTLRLSGLEPLAAEPPLWQCIGMFVATFGVGYAIAARDPFRHWPIVLIGLLGKVFGPLGFLFAATAGTLPWSFGWMLLTNDLIWWLPFAAILWQAARAHHIRSPLDDSDPLHTVRSQYGRNLVEQSRDRNVLVVFLRHSGCTFCRETLADLSRHQESLASAGVDLALVHLADDASAAEFFGRYGLADVDRYSDPECRLYRAFGLEPATFGQLLGPKVWWRGFQVCVLQRHGFSTQSDQIFQMPGVFLIRDGQVLRSFRHRSPADRPDYLSLATSQPTSEPPPPEDERAKAQSA